MEAGGRESYYRLLQAWLNEASQERLATDHDISVEVSKMSETALSALRVDLDGLHDSSLAIWEALEQVLRRAPCSDHLEDALVELESHMNHMIYHWNDLLKRLRDEDQFPDD